MISRLAVTSVSGSESMTRSLLSSSVRVRTADHSAVLREGFEPLADLCLREDHVLLRCIVHARILARPCAARPGLGPCAGLPAICPVGARPRPGLNGAS